jgi:hypothetical protein
MKKGIFRFFIRAWLSVTSLIVFIMGWAFLGHSGKPASGSPLVNSSSQQLAPLPTLAPLPQLDSGASIQMLPQQSPNIAFQPRFRTRGS